MKNIKKQYKGFTLIELLIVIVIIGILVAICLPQYQIATLRTRYGALKNMAHKIAEAEQRYYMLHDSYTKDFNKLDIDMPGKISSSGTYFYYNGNGSKDMFCEFNSNDAIRCKVVAKSSSILVYNVYFDLSRRECHAISTSNIAKKVCQQETGKSSPTYPDSHNVYKY